MNSKEVLLNPLFSNNPIGLQIVENIPFFHSIAYICFQELGYGIEALTNLLLILAFTSILVGISFYFLGAFLDLWPFLTINSV